MTKSANLKFDYLVEAQGQKHLTVNNALAKIDAMSQLVVRGERSNASAPKDGEVYREGDDLAIYLNGGFESVKAKSGWEAYFEDEDARKRFDGSDWQDLAQVSALSKEEFLLDLAQANAVLIEEKSVVFGVTARVVEAIKGEGVSSWKIGVADDPSRYGSGLWLGKNGWSKGLTGSPVTYWSDTDLTISGEGGTIVSGKVLLYVYALKFALPPEV